MPDHAMSDADRDFRRQFESGAVLPAEFDHRAHLRLAYVYLSDGDAAEACDRMRAALRAFLDAHYLDAAKYHETMTRAWILAVRHFMARSGRTASAEDFIERNPQLLDAKIMLTHYSAGLLFSDEARDRFVAPDLDPMPRGPE